MTDPTYPDFITFRRGHPPQPAVQEESVRVYADLNGELRTLQSDGTDTSVAALQRLATDISSVEILALHSSPVEVVPAQGVGTVIVPTVLSTQFKFVSAAYTVAADLDFIYGADTTDVVAKLGVDPSLTHSQFGINGARPLLQDFVAETLADLENQPINLYATSANPTSGDSILRMAVQYFVFDLA